MLPRRRYHPQDHFSIGVPIRHSHGLACGEMLFVGGQVDLDDDIRPTRPGDLDAQTRICMEGVDRVLKGLNAEMSDLVSLRAFYVLGDHDVDECQILDAMAATIPSDGRPGPTVSLVPLDGLVYEDMLIEIEGIAMRGHNGERLARTAAWIPDGATLPAAFSQGLRCGEMIFTSAQTALAGDGIAFPHKLVDQSRVTLGKLDRLLRQLGADLHDAVKANVFNVEPGVMEDWKEAALVRAGFYKEPGPAATGISVRRLAQDGLMVRSDVFAMRGLDGSRLPRRGVWPTDHWDWPVHLPYRHGLQVGDMIFLGGQVSLTADADVIDPGNMAAQTHTAMQNIDKVLAELGLGPEHIMRVNTFYAGATGADLFHQNVAIRSDYYREPWPVSTGVPVPYLAYEDMVIEIDVIAMV